MSLKSANPQPIPRKDDDTVFYAEGMVFYGKCDYCEEEEILIARSDGYDFTILCRVCDHCQDCGEDFPCECYSDPNYDGGWAKLYTPECVGHMDGDKPIPMIECRICSPIEGTEPPKKKGKKKK